MPIKKLSDKGLKIQTVSVAGIQPHPKNVRVHDERNIQAIMQSLDEFGQRSPIVIGRDSLIIKGCGTLEAAKRLGWKTIQVINTYNTLTPEQELAYAIADNKTSDTSEFDFENLAGLMKELAEAGVDLKVTGFEEFELEPLMQAEWQPPAVEDMPGEDSITDGKVKIIFTENQWENIQAAIDRCKEAKVVESDQDDPAIIADIICPTFLLCSPYKKIRKIKK